MTNLEVLCGVDEEDVYLTPFTYLPLNDIHLLRTDLLHTVWYVQKIVLVHMSTYSTWYRYKYAALTRRSQDNIYNIRQQVIDKDNL